MFLARLKEDIDTILIRDPAARSRLEVLLCYPGVHAMLVYRLSHWLWRRDWKLLARFLSHTAKVFTGVEIHPGATIGRRVFIDHATGVVIGETAEVGDDVTLYQGVTLGGTSLKVGKRHPTLHDGVIVGSGAQILGPHVIGAGARVGANAVVLTDVAPGTTVVGIPAKAVLRQERNQAEEFCAYGMPNDELPDPVARAMDALRDQMRVLADRVETLQDRLAAAEERPPDGDADRLPRVVVAAGDDTPGGQPSAGGEDDRARVGRL
jgi:serine O-acetyltransferase